LISEVEFSENCGTFNFEKFPSEKSYDILKKKITQKIQALNYSSIN